MYFTSFHKAVFKQIWKKNKSGSKKKFDLEFYLKFIKDWYSKKYKKQLWIRNQKSDLKKYMFSGYEFDENKQYIVKNDYKDDVVTAFKELTSVLTYLENNELIGINKKSEPKCLPLFCENDNELCPFDDALNIVKPYIGKNIVIREGFVKFRNKRYMTHEELLRFIIGIWIPVAGLILTILIKLFDSLFKQ